MGRYVVTGGAGFLGSHLCDALIERGESVVAVDNLVTGRAENLEHLFGTDSFQFVRHDVTEYLWVPGDVDAVLHLASPASPVDYLELPIQTLKVGSLGTHNSLGLAREKHARFLLASTSEVYGDPDVHPQPESYWGNVNTIGIRACYDEGKRCAETLFFDYYRQNNVNIRVVRIFNTYGPHMHPNDGRVISNFIIQALKDEAITIFGDGSQTRSFCFVDDLVEGMIKMMDAPDSFIGPVNLGNPVEHKIIELAELIIKMTGSKSRLEFLPAPKDDPQRRQPDISLAKEKLGWEPKVHLEEGLGRTIQYFRDLLSQK